jgi:hypothetical protein
LNFTRDAPDAVKAVLSALDDVHRAVPSAKLMNCDAVCKHRFQDRYDAV